MLVSTGERVAMSLLSIAIRARGEHAISFTGSQCGIITNDRHFDARIIEVRPHRIEDELARGRIVIVAGYQGMSYRREITTLGRGGSDTTAVALAAALEAERCEIYSDVDGVYSADPRAVPDARHLPELDYDTLQQMAECGAKVLCAGAVEFARRAGIAIYARSTFEAVSDTPKQTVIRRHGPASEPRARAVSCDRNLALVRCGSDGALSAVLEVMQRHELSVAELMHGQDGAAVLIPLLSAPDWPAGRAALLALTGVGPLELVENVASVSLVAGGLAARPDAVARFAEVLVAAGAPARTVLASALRITALIERDRVDDAQRALHAVFC
jgi:aspartate kinase